MKYLVLILILLLIAGCVEEGEQKMDEKILSQPVDVNLRTDDDYSIKGTFYPNENSTKGLILVHQFGMDRTSWKPWILMFQKEYNVIAIDLRGHGESQGDVAGFSEDNFRAMINDIKAAYDFLKRKELNQISIVGASIGANQAQNFASDNDVHKLVLLSPGKEYHGIVLNMVDNSAFVIVSEDDVYSFESVIELERISPNSKFLYLKQRGHGTKMLDDGLVNRIIEFINN